MEAAQDAQVILNPAAQVLQLIRLWPGRMALRGILPVLLALLAGGLMLLGNKLASPPLRSAGIALGILGGVGLLLVFKLLYPQAALEVIGTLEVQPAALLWQLAGEAPRYEPLLPGGPLVTIWYNGYAGEYIGRYELPGYEKFLAVDKGPRYRFWAPDAGVPIGLQALLRNWYRRRIPVKEYCQDSRTFLLERDLSYEQIQAYKQEFGVSLYN